jgi:hypothetical protein
MAGRKRPLTDEEAQRALRAVPSSKNSSPDLRRRDRQAIVPGERIASYKLFYAYCDLHLEYAREALPLVEANRKAAIGRKGEPRRAKTHCVNGHLFAENARVALHKGWMVRQCRACELVRYRRGGVIKLDVLEKVTTRRRPVSESPGCIVGCADSLGIESTANKTAQKLSLFSATVTLEACLDETQARVWRLPGKSDDVASIVIPRRRISCQHNVTPTQGRMDRPSLRSL